MKLNMKIGLTAGISLMILWLVLSAWRIADHEEALVSTSQPPHPSQERELASAPKGDTPSSPQQKEPRGAGTIGLKNYILGQHPAAIEARVEAKDAFIGRYRLLGQRKVLLTKEEADELDSMLQDQEKRKLYQEYLQGIEVRNDSMADEQIYRIFLVQYLESSWIVSKDPDILDFLIDFVLRDNFSKGLTTEVKKVLAYEKVKVLEFLQQHNPKALELIQDKMQGLRHEKLLRDYFDKQHAT